MYSKHGQIRRTQSKMDLITVSIHMYICIFLMDSWGEKSIQLVQV